MEQEAQVSSSTYTIEALLTKAGILSQKKILEKIEGLVRVKGVVTKINRYSNIMYLTLEDRNLQISVKCDGQLQVSENDSVVVEGCLFLKPSAFFTGLDCYIDGTIVGSWKLEESGLGNLPQLKKHRYIPLADLLDEIDVTSFLLLGTQIGITDTLSQLSTSISKEIPTKIIRVYKSDTLLTDIKESFREGTKAIAIVRGGDDKTMSVWDDAQVVAALLELNVPFYTALGHSHSVTLADRFADSSYHTPTALGRALSSVLSHKIAVENAAQECISLKAENKFLKESSVTKTPPPKSISFKWVAFFIVYTLIIFVIAKIK